MTILHIDSSILGDHSVTRALSQAIVTREAAIRSEAEIIHHDLAADPVDYLSSAHLKAFQGGGADETLADDLARGARFVDEIFAADVIVIGAPMYNFSIPAQLKSWIDRILVAGKTFHYGANGPEGLVSAGKKVIIASGRGGIYSAGAPAAALDHQETLLTAALRFIGLTDIEIVRAEGVALGETQRAEALSQAHQAIAALEN